MPKLLETCSAYPELTLENASHIYKYYGVDRDRNLEVIKKLERYLKKQIPEFTRFCNFKTNKDGSKSVRYLCMYSPMFEGVNYTKVSDLI